MKQQAKTPVFQEDNCTWSHLTKLVNPLICTIEYGRRTGFSSREEAEESYQCSLASYQDQLSKLKKERDMPFTFSEYLDYWLNDVCAQGSNSSRTLVQKQWTINLIIQPHLHKDILLGCITPDYLNKVLESCQAYCCNGGYYAYKLLHSALKHARINNCLPDMDFQQIRHYPEPSQNPVFYSPEQLRTFLTAASNSNHYLEIQLALFCGLTPGDDDDKIRLNQRKPSKYKGLRRFGPEKNLQRINKFMKERPIFYKNLIQMKENIRFYLRCFYCITKVMILQFNSENRTELARNG